MRSNGKYPPMAPLAERKVSPPRCEAQLVQISATLNTACGCDTGNCDKGVPSSCDASEKTPSWPRSWANFSLL